MRVSMIADLVGGRFFSATLGEKAHETRDCERQGKPQTIVLPTLGEAWGRAPVGRASLLLAGLAFWALGSDAALAQDAVRVRPGYATVLKFDKAFSTVVIGDPQVADVLPRGDRAVLLSGRAVGTTNLIVLDADSNELFNTTVIVRVS